MNRPNKKDDPNYPFEFPDTYLGELEKYCDELEEENKKQKRALDKAIDQLQEAHFVSLVNYVYPYQEKEKWKEELMKDE